MFKKIILLILSMFLLLSCMSVQPASPEDLFVEEIIEVDGFQKDQLYDLSNRWFVESFKSAEAVIEYQDKEQGIIMGKYTYSAFIMYGLGSTNLEAVKPTIQINVKDNTVRIRIMNPMVELVTSASKYFAASNEWREPYAEELEKIDFKQNANNIISDYKTYISKNDLTW